MQIRLLTGKGESMIGQLSVSGCVDTFLAFHQVISGSATELLAETAPVFPVYALHDSLPLN